jgi:prolyl-tRNA synthetase
MYSFHKDQNDAYETYDKVKIAYEKIFKRLSLDFLAVDAGIKIFKNF